MAQGKNIEIKIAVVGADQAAGEIRKVETAQDGLGTSGESASQALDEAAVNTEGFREAAGALGDALANTGGATGGFGRALVAMAGGPVSIAISAIGAVIGLMMRWKQSLDDWEKSQSEAAASYADFTQEMIKSQKDFETEIELKEQAAQRGREYAEAIAQAAGTQSQMNEALKAEIDLLNEKRKAEEEIAAAKGELELTGAGDDAVKKEEIRNRLRKEKQARELAGIDEERARKQDLLDRKEADAGTVGTKGNAFADDLKARAAAAAAELAEKERLAKSLRKTQEDNKAVSEDDSVPFDQRRVAARAGGVVGRRADALDEEIKTLAPQAKDLAKQAEDARATVKKEVDGIVAEMNRLFEQIQKLDRDKATKTEVFNTRDQAGALRVDQVRGADKEKRDAATQKAEEKAKRDAEMAERDRVRRETGGRNLEANAVPFTKEAADAARGLGARSGITDGLERLGQ